MSKGLLDAEGSVERIQSGDRDLLEQFIADSIPFVKRAVRNITHSYFVEQEDEYSIALEAFHQAIYRYKVGGAVPFEPYALLLIKNRLLNWIRDQKQTRQVLTMTDCETEDGVDLADRLSDPRADHIQQNLEFEEAMMQLECELQMFGLHMSGLSGKLPHHQDTRRLCIRVAQRLTGDEALYTDFMHHHRLPCAELSRRSQIPVKTIEKNRSTIILFTLLLHSELDAIKYYISSFEEGSK
jgi:RNA polymerase sigma factor